MRLIVIAKVEFIVRDLKKLARELTALGEVIPKFLTLIILKPFFCKSSVKDFCV